ncbi:uncharacterized protein LOC119369524 [Jatropha curcas]|uniref:uncharacterized protein LOC119369524 n=1 Tax=Jatropha curcas TaxID=180498 RepID=UPI00189612BC|nr:uncharacterized protein LOC119369524 [Jatropha curcas]
MLGMVNTRRRTSGNTERAAPDEASSGHPVNPRHRRGRRNRNENNQEEGIQEIHDEENVTENPAGMSTLMSGLQRAIAAMNDMLIQQQQFFQTQQQQFFSDSNSNSILSGDSTATATTDAIHPMPDPATQPFQPAPPTTVPRAANDNLYDRFIRYKPPKFTGTEDAHSFLARIREFCTELGCDDERSIIFAGRRMEGMAEMWFRDYVLPMVKGMYWQQFSSLFIDRFIPEGTRRAKMREFESLVQGNLSIDEYATRFLELSRYAPGSVPDEATKVYRFISGLNAVYDSIPAEGTRF